MKRPPIPTIAANTIFHNLRLPLFIVVVAGHVLAPTIILALGPKVRGRQDWPGDHTRK